MFHISTWFLPDVPCLHFVVGEMRWSWMCVARNAMLRRAVWPIGTSYVSYHDHSVALATHLQSFYPWHGRCSYRDTDQPSPMVLHVDLKKLSSFLESSHQAMRRSSVSNACVELSGMTLCMWCLDEVQKFHYLTATRSSFSEACIINCRGYTELVF